MTLDVTSKKTFMFLATYLLNVGLSLSAVASLSLCIPAALTIVLGGEGGARGGVGSGNRESYVVRRRRHHVRQ
jgi:hypothetical protein